LLDSTVSLEESPIISERIHFSETRASVFLDLVRGLAAMLVFLSHWRNLFFIDFPQVSSHKWLLAPFYLFTSGGHQGVVIFFVLSGYLISSSVFREIARQTWSWPSYFLRRLVRLWVVLVPCLLLGVMWDLVGWHLGRTSAIYNGLGVDSVVSDMHVALTAPVFFGNLFFLQTIHFPTLGTNGPLWSLSHEFWFYILFPMGVFAVLRRTKLMHRLLCAGGFLLVATFVGHAIRFTFPIWLYGAGLALVPVPRVGGLTRGVAAAIYLVTVFTLAKTEFPYSDHVLAIATAFLLWILLSATARKRRSTEERMARTVARFSYTLYLVHAPLMILMVSLMLGDRRWVPTPGHLLAAFGVLLLTLGVSYGVASVTEFHTDAVRWAIERRLGMARDRSVAVLR
jgi:peptidoglycan/LPS O-acetylase OafA/YrhL